MANNKVQKNTKKGIGKKIAVGMTTASLTLLLGTSAYLIGTNWWSIKAGLKGQNLFTQDQVQEKVDQAYQEGLGDSLVYQNAIKELTQNLRKTEASLNQVLAERDQIVIEREDLQLKLDELNTQLDELNKKYTNVSNEYWDNYNKIAEYEKQIEDLNKLIEDLNKQDGNNTELINQLNTQVDNLQNLVTQLQTTNDLNLSTIASLNAQISNLKQQINDMTSNSQTASGQINALNNKIAELQASINYYETYISSLQNETQVVITFEVAGSVYNIQIVNKGSKCSVTTPASTTYRIFNGWTVNGQTIDLSNYNFDVNTKVVADFTYKYDVKFMVDNEVVDSKIIESGAYPTLPSNPTKEGYVFEGWSSNGVDIINDITTTPVTSNVTYYAVFSKTYTVTFVNGEENTTYKVKNGSMISEIPEVESTPVKTFNGWKLNGSFVDPTTYQVYGDTTFVADFTIKTFSTMSWDEISNLSASGEASTYLNVGDEKTITATIEGVKQELTFVILGFNHDDLADGTGKAGISIGLKGYVTGKNGYVYNSNTNGGYKYVGSSYEKTILPNILSNLPTELKQNIKTVSKGCCTAYPTDSDNDVKIVNCDLFLFSVNEVCGDNKLSDRSTQYDYFKKNDLYIDIDGNILSRDYTGGYQAEISAGGWEIDGSSSTLLCFGFCI